MATFSSSLSQLRPISLWERTVFIKCTPSPATFTQRRAVLRALQKDTAQGIEVFRKFKSDSGSFYAVTTKPEAASALISGSPFERTLISEDPTILDDVKKTEWGAMYAVPRTITTPVNPLPRLQATPTTDASNELGLSHTMFTIHCFPPNPTFDHLQTVRSHPLHGPWPDNGGRETLISASLMKSVPVGPLAPSLRDWETGNQLWRDPTNSAEEACEGALSILLGRPLAHKYQWERTRARIKAKERPEVMKSLTAFAAKYRKTAAGPHEGQRYQASSSNTNFNLGQSTTMGHMNEPTRAAPPGGSWGAGAAQQTEKPIDKDAFQTMLDENSATKGRSKSNTTE
ncbi:hypothetical protein SLS62_008092 [Diatrype stigma]|uniref:Uncharacterized protein n=1 Tax=Diatrype stigma TaxID=117547 RepID=A0AAN9UM94_9PEZI